MECQELPQEALSLAEVNKLPVPVLIENFIDTFDF
jgi:A/G-specific adenine glycosylase